MSEDPGFSLQVIQCQGQQSKKTQDDRLHQLMLDLSFLSVDKLISANQIGRSSNIFYPQDSFVTKVSISNPKWYQRLADQLLDLTSLDHWSLIKLISCYLLISCSLSVDHQVLSADQRVWLQWSSRSDWDIMKPSPSPSACIDIGKDQEMRIYKRKRGRTRAKKMRNDVMFHMRWGEVKIYRVSQKSVFLEIFSMYEQLAAL